MNNIYYVGGGITPQVGIFAVNIGGCVCALERNFKEEIKKINKTKKLK